MNKDYYKILELKPGSSASEIKNAYRRLAKKYHPDINKSEDAQQNFIEINEAYEILMHRIAHAQPLIEGQTKHDENYDEFIRKVREAAQQRARMRYEKFIRESEAFRESGLYDIVLALKYIGSAILPFFAIGLISLPFIIAYTNHEFQAIFYLFFFWVIGIFLLFIIYQKRKNYFKLGKFYYNYNKIKAIYEKNDTPDMDECIFCKGHKANSVPYSIDFYKITSINLQNNGPLQHYAGYKRTIHKEILPRSVKAFKIHTLCSIIKSICVIISSFFFPVDSIIWRFIIGILIGWLLSSIILLFSFTKSKVGYLFSWGTLIKITVWLGIMAFTSTFSFHPFNIKNSEYIQFIIAILLFGDAFLEQFIKLPMKMKIFKPILRSYKKLDHCFDENYFLYLEIPIWTAIYPIFRWIF